MARSFGILLEEMDAALKEALNERLAVSRYLACFKVCEAAVKRMKAMVIADPFADAAEEVHHFKYEAPEIYSRLFFYLRLGHFETSRPHTEPEAFKDLLRKEKAALDAYFQDHDYICRYYNQGATHMDEYLFVRRPEEQWLGDERGTMIAPDFTIGTYWISGIKANSQLRETIRAELDGLALPSVLVPAGGLKKARLTWTANQVDWIELANALHLKGCFNNGKASLSEIMDWGEAELGVKKGQHFARRNDMSIRKEPTGFLKSLVEELEKKFKSLL